LDRLIAAIEKRKGIEDEISRKTDSLREKCAHVAILINAVYTARKESAEAVLAHASQVDQKK
jgi:hypothetical protein